MCALSSNAQNFKEPKGFIFSIEVGKFTIGNSFTANSFNMDSCKTFIGKNSLVMDNFSRSKFQKVAEKGFKKRDLLFKDTDTPVKLFN